MSRRNAGMPFDLDANGCVRTICRMFVGRLMEYKIRDVRCVPIIDGLHLLEQKPVGISFFRKVSGVKSHLELVHTSFQDPELFNQFQAYLDALRPSARQQLLNSAISLNNHYLMAFHAINLSRSPNQASFSLYHSPLASQLIATLSNAKDSSLEGILYELIDFLQNIQDASLGAKNKKGDNLLPLGKTADDAFMTSLRYVLDDIYQDLSSCVRPWASFDSSERPMLSPLCWVRTAGIRPLRRGAYNYTMRMILSHGQHEKLSDWLHAMRAKDRQELQNWVQPLRSIDYDSHKLREQLEIPLGLEEWSIVDLPFNSGYIHFSDSIEYFINRHNKATDLAGTRMAAHHCILHDVPEQALYLHMPIHVSGVPWINFTLMVPRASSEGHPAWELINDTYDHMLNHMAKRLRVATKNQYLQELGRHFRDSLCDGPALDISSINERFCSLGSCYPFSIVSLKGYDETSQADLVLPGRRVATIVLQDNPHFERQIELSLLERTEVVDFLGGIVYKHMKAGLTSPKIDTDTFSHNNSFLGQLDASISSDNIGNQHEINRIMAYFSNWQSQGNMPLNITVRNGFVGDSESMLEIVKKIEAIAKTDVDILLLGETGTGKDVAANVLHALSSRGKKRWQVMDCSVFDSGTAASEIFGHVKGAFTGADHERIGRLEAADGSTLFLSEIGDYSSDVQIRLLRFLQYRVFSRIGENVERPVEVRVISATNKKLLTECEEGKFRKDLYYRLCENIITIPNLRERRQDIPLLVLFFMKTYKPGSGGKAWEAISLAALESLVAYSWPGNVRQLESALKGMLSETKESVLYFRDLRRYEIFKSWGIQDIFFPQKSDEDLIDLQKVVITRSGTVSTDANMREERALSAGNHTASNNIPTKDLSAGLSVFSRRLISLLRDSKKNIYKIKSNMHIGKNDIRSESVLQDLSVGVYRLALEAILALLRDQNTSERNSIPMRKMVEVFGRDNIEVACALFEELRTTVDTQSASRGPAYESKSSKPPLSIRSLSYEDLMKELLNVSKAFHVDNPEINPVLFLTNVAAMLALREITSLDVAFKMVGISRDMMCARMNRPDKKHIKDTTRSRRRKRNFMELMADHAHEVEQLLRPFLEQRHPV